MFTKWLKKNLLLHGSLFVLVVFKADERLRKKNAGHKRFSVEALREIKKKKACFLSAVFGCVYRLGASATSAEVSESGDVVFQTRYVICTAAVVKWLGVKSLYKRLYRDFSWDVRLGCWGSGPFENHRRISTDKHWYSKRAPAKRPAFRMWRLGVKPRKPRCVPVGDNSVSNATRLCKGSRVCFHPRVSELRVRDVHTRVFARV